MNTENSVDQITHIVGDAEEFKILKSINPETGEKNYKSYFLTPVPIGKLPMLQKKLEAFFVEAETPTKKRKKNESDPDTLMNEKMIDAACGIIKMSIDKLHPNVTEDEIKNDFDLGSMVKAISKVMGLNDFLSEMQALSKTMLELNQMKGA
jgi:hypothetical protein